MISLGMKGHESLTQHLQEVPMNKLFTIFLLLFSIPALSELPVIAVAAEDQAAMLKSDSPELAANKKLVYDLWRTLVVARHVDSADMYLTEDYMQHNPNAKTGLAGVKAYFSRAGMEPRPIKDTVDDLVAIIAEGDMVTMAFAREFDNPKMPGEKYHTTWFDMFRVEDGKVAEHWDPATITAP
jgi:predicted SnoaL-like aldol condensation-catalyzing enzyme